MKKFLFWQWKPLPLEPADILIGVTGVYYNIPVYTHNTKHFKLIKNISLYQEVS